MTQREHGLKRQPRLKRQLGPKQQITLARQKFEEIESAIRANTLDGNLYLTEAVEIGIPIKIATGHKNLVERMINYKIMPRKTWESAKKSKSQKLTPQNSERLLRVLRIEEKAKNAFGKKAGNEWIERPTTVFNGKAPIEMLTNESGSRAVELFLNRIMHGFNA